MLYFCLLCEMCILWQFLMLHSASLACICSHECFSFAIMKGFGARFLRHQPHVWDAISHSSKYYILSETQLTIALSRLLRGKSCDTNLLIHHKSPMSAFIICIVLCACTEVLLMWVLYVRFRYKVRPRTFWCVAMGSAVLFILRSKLLLYSGWKVWSEQSVS